MATAKEIKEEAYLVEVYKALEGIKMRLSVLREDLARTHGKDSRMFLEHDRHLLEMREYIEWKQNVLEKGTPFDWKTVEKSIESDVSVQPAATLTGPDFSGGYIGG